ncbi:MAG: GTPase HflX [candidate division Zixibacteria bacterium]|nr:GTPase HflX [candidate division Zixibacteria bacterium]
MHETGYNKKAERAILVGCALGKTRKQEIEYSINELARLIDTAGGIEVQRFIQKRNRPDGATYIGKGMIEEIKECVEDKEIDLVVFDDQLSPNQMRNISQALDVKVIDRPMLILDIFALHARSHESRLQVDLAQMEYLLPRLTGLWQHFSRQRGGIGAKGPGETQLEVDRRQVGKKIAILKKKLKKVDKQRQTQRKGRENFFKIALVGYTNAGKSTLFNRLTRSDVLQEDKLFSTLDSTTRVISVNYPQNIVITDTVGFIEKLPHQLVASFKSTLEEVNLADLILLIVDASDPYKDRKIEVVRTVLDEIKASKVPRLIIYNKVDLLGEDDAVPAPDNGHIPISALKNIGLARLKTEILARFG